MTLAASDPVPERYDPEPRPGTDETWLNTLRKHQQRIGVSRLGDLTGLDHIGVPVWFACRPNSRSLSVCQGKALDGKRAMIGALMEAAEQHFAEQALALETNFLGTFGELQASGRRSVPLDRMSGCVPERLDLRARRMWVAGRSLLADEEVFTPYELVGLDYTTDSPWDRAAFRMTTVGLAAGREESAAVLHGILEVIENDATQLVDTFGASTRFLQPLEIESSRDRELIELVRLVREAGLALSLAEVVTVLPLPVIAAVVSGASTDDARGSVRTHAGFACRPSPEDAARAALLEAVQSRLTDISGAREDIAPSAFELFRPEQRDGRAATEPIKQIGDIPHLGTTPEMGDAILEIGKAIDAIRKAEFFVFPLGGQEIDANVVRVLASGLENAAEDDEFGELNHSALRSLVHAAGLD